MIAFKNCLHRVFNWLGYDLYNRNQSPVNASVVDLEEEFNAAYREIKPYTMTSPEKMYALVSGVKYVLDNQIPGSFVECGVWRGGSSMMMAEALLQRAEKQRHLYLYDTFAGMSAPCEHDVDCEGVAAQHEWVEKNGDTHNAWCYASLEEVRQNMKKTGYPFARIHFIQGDVTKTLAEHKPDKIALLRLDTDFYASTVAELKHLYPRLAPGGVLVIDDYGYWKGQKKAVDEYFSTQKKKPFFIRVDGACRVAVKPSWMSE